MANLFPTQIVSEDATDETSQPEVKFGRSWKFDFEKGDFVFAPTGKVVEADELEAWLEWCNKAVRTARYKHLVYSREQGHEFSDLIRRNLTKKAKELEIKRIVTETLMVSSRTAKVDNFTFMQQEDAIYFTCEITNVRGDTGKVSGSVVTN